MLTKVQMIQQLRAERKTHAEIGELLGLSKQRIQQICKKKKIEKPSLPPKPSYFEKRKNYLLNNYTENPETGCWNWSRYTGEAGYGVMSFLGRKAYVHRVAYSLLKDHSLNVFLEGRNTETTTHVCHSCDNPSCINPEHLWLGTMEENMNDRDSKQRGKNYTQKNKEI